MAARRVVRGESFSLHYREASSDSGVRLGLMVPKRLARASSLRNAIKRQGREAFRLVAGEIPPFDLVLRLTRPIKGVAANDDGWKKVWRTEIENLLKRLPARSQ